MLNLNLEIGTKFPPDSFLYEGEVYEVLGESNKTNLISSEVCYGAKQFICTSRSGVLYDACIYQHNGKSHLSNIQKRGEKTKKEK